MFKSNQTILDVTEVTNPAIHKTLTEYAAYHEYGQRSFYQIDVFDIMEYIDNEDNQELKDGWWDLLSAMKQANIFKFTLLYWW